MTSRKRPPVPRLALLLFALIVALGGAAGTVAISSEPSEGTITVAEPTAWSGSVQGESLGAACGQPGSESTGRCDAFTLNVDVDPKYWESFEGGAEVAFTPTAGAATANLNALVFDSEGNEVASAAATTPGGDKLTIKEASRAGSPYRIVIYNRGPGTAPSPVSTDTTEYKASARVESRAKTPTNGGTSDAPIPAAPVSDAPCIDGKAAGVFPCENVDLKSFLPISSLGGVTPGASGDETVDDAANDRLNDIWGWVDPETKREYAIVG